MQAPVQAFVGLLAGAGAVELLAAPAARNARASIGVWVWRVSDHLVGRPGLAPPQAPPMPPPAQLHCLVFAPDLAVLDQVRTLVHRSPVLPAAQGAVTVTSEPLAPELLVALFSAAGVAPRPCLSVVLRASPA